jgi:hypothetical protein
MFSSQIDRATKMVTSSGNKTKKLGRCYKSEAYQFANFSIEKFQLASMSDAAKARASQLTRAVSRVYVLARAACACMFQPSINLN